MFKSESVKEIVETICINIEKSRVPLEGSILSTSPSSHPSLRALSRPGEVKMGRCEVIRSHCLLCLSRVSGLASSHQFPHLLRGSVVALISTHNKLSRCWNIRNILITLDIWLKTSPLQGSFSVAAWATTLKFHRTWLWRGDKNCSPQEGFVFQFLLAWVVSVQPEQ